MEAPNAKALSASLPLTHPLTLSYAFSLVVAATMAVASAAGLLYPTRLYPTDALRQSFVANDVVNLAVGLPILIGSMWLARRGRLIGLLLWPGALFYVPYNYLVYTFALPLNLGFLFSLVLLAASTYTMAGLIASIDGGEVRRRLRDVVPARLAGGILAGLGVAFSLLAIGTVIDHLVNQTPIDGPELALQVADFVVSPAWVIGGILLWRRQPFGFVAGAGLLFQASMLFVGLIVFLLLQPLLTAAPFALVDVVVTTILGLICFVPFGLFVRGLLSADRTGNT
ncbi:MAG: hypothetical protein ACK2VD_24040 [Anaerolineae bacterium]|jgi:hypothetical protein